MNSGSGNPEKSKRSSFTSTDKIDSFSRRALFTPHKRATIDTEHLMRRAEDLVSAASNRYRITVQVANRAKRRRYEDFDSMEEPTMKPVIRAIVEMFDELAQPEIIGD